MPPARGRWTRWLVLIYVVTLLAGILFGYDQGVIAGALHGMSDEFDLGSTMKEVITSWVTLGALFGALFAGGLADRVGRRAAVLLAAGLFAMGALVEALAPGTTVLVTGRLIVGFGVGVASVAAPLYASETAPTSLRGRFVSSYQLAITIGILVAYAVDWALTNSESWRGMLGASAVPALLLLLVAWPLRDTPRWYMKRGEREKAGEPRRCLFWTNSRWKSPIRPGTSRTSSPWRSRAWRVVARDLRGIIDRHSCGSSGSTRRKVT